MDVVIDPEHPVGKFEYLFDASRLLNEYRLLQTDQLVPDQYQTFEIYNTSKNGFTEAIKQTCPYTMEVVESLKDKIRFNFVLYRALMPQSTLWWHKDPELEHITYHIPILTNEACFYVYGGKIHSMQEVGRLYGVETTDTHTFFNAHRGKPRVHIHFFYDTWGVYLNGSNTG